MKFRDMKNNIKYKFQRAKKGYCDEDLFSMDGWFIRTFPKMLSEFSENTCGSPVNTENLVEEVSKMPKIWVESQKEKVINIFKSHDFDNEFDLNDPFCCWLLIVLRMKYCFEMCDEFNNEYEKYHETGFYEILNDAIEENKKEAFYLFEKWFFNLWW